MQTKLNRFETNSIINAIRNSSIDIDDLYKINQDKERTRLENTFSLDYDGVMPTTFERKPEERHPLSF